MTDEDNSRVVIIVKIRFIAKLRLMCVKLCYFDWNCKILGGDYVNLSASREEWKFAYISEAQP